MYCTGIQKYDYKHIFCKFEYIYHLSYDFKNIFGKQLNGKCVAPTLFKRGLLKNTWERYIRYLIKKKGIWKQKLETKGKSSQKLSFILSLQKLYWSEHRIS